MASSTEYVHLIKLITCSVCTDIFENPHRLCCSHVFCKNCLEQLKIINEVECPECNTVSKVSSATLDFNKDRLVDLYFKKYGFVQRDGHRHSGFSHLFPVSSKLGRQSNKKETGDIEKSTKAKIALFSNLKQAKQREYVPFRGLYGITPPNFLYLVPREKTSVHVSSSIKDDNTRGQNIETQIKDINFNIFKSTLISYVPDEFENFTHKQTCKDKTGNAPKLSKLSQDHKYQNQQSSLSSQIQSHWRNECPNYSLSPKSNSDTNIQQQHFCKLHSITLNFSPRRLHKTSTSLWCTTNNGICVYDDQFNVVQSIIISELDREDLSYAVQDNHLNILVASRKSGLCQADSFGKHMLKISDGSFSDLRICKNFLYALDSANNKVKIFQQRKHYSWFYYYSYKWIFIKQIDLSQHMKCSISDTLCIFDGCIYVCSWISSCLFKFTFSGELVDIIGQKGSGQPGKLSSPMICAGNTSDSKVFVADMNNNQIQTLSNDGCWQILSFPETIYRPRDVYVSKDESKLCIFTADIYCKKLVLYETTSSS